LSCTFLSCTLLLPCSSPDTILSIFSYILQAFKCDQKNYVKRSM
jgi:hypothetical protein